jgi:putative hydrolase of the HAD superfamily
LLLYLARTKKSANPKTMPHSSESLNLIFDADDTLWDSNIHFLEAEESFVAAVTEAGIAAEKLEICEMVRRCELEIIKTQGYGRGPYLAALHNAVDLLTELEEFRALIKAEVERIGRRFLERRCELLPGVEPTLKELVKRHKLLLFTKGQRQEQMLKLERSGLAPLFSQVEIAAEKNLGAYLDLIDRAMLDRQRTFMIGNSPRSDINPAIKAGLRAVYIPHPHTWVLEHEELQSNEGVTIVTSFPRLLELF